MAWTFGGATGDDITCTVTALSSGRHMLVSGWWYPTTLTATRGLWSMGATCGVEINTTTSELRLKTQHATTAGEWTTTGVGLTLNQWQFLAFLVSVNSTGPSDAWRVWSGTNEISPQECTVTSAVAPVGTVTSNTAFSIGNKGSTGTLAFQGDIEHVYAGINLATIDVTQNAIPLATAGTITQAEADFVLGRIVAPLWAGNRNILHLMGGPPSTRSGMDWFYFPLDAVLTTTIRRHTPATANSPDLAVSTVNAAFSQNRGPRAYMEPHMHHQLRAH